MRDSDHATLAHYHNAFQRERAFIIGTGPSLLKVNPKLIQKLKTEITFGLNFLVLVKDWPFMPTFACVSEIDWLDRIDKTLNESPLNSTFREPLAKFISNVHCPDLYYNDNGKLYEDWIWLYTNFGYNMQREGEFTGLGGHFDYVPIGNGVLFSTAVPVACWMGFKEIYILGCESTKRGHAHPYSEATGFKIDRDRQDTTYRSAMTALTAVEGTGRKLIDCTEGGLLPLPKMKLKDVLK